MKRFRRTRTVVRASAVALVTAALVFAGTSLLFGSKSGALVSGTNFTITSPSPGPVLYPLATTPSNLPLTFSNPLSQPIRVYSLTVSFTNTFPSGCPYSELTLNGTAVSLLPSPVSAPGVTFSFTGSSFAVPKAVGATPGTATDNLTLALPENHLNQDACKGLALALKYSASAYYTDSTTSVLGSSPNPSNAGQAITLSDTVTTTTDSNVPVGSVVFYSCTTASCSTTTALGAVVPLSGGVASTTTTPATGGTYYYVAIFTPTDSTNFTASTSNIIAQTVNSTSGSKVFLRSSENPTPVGDSVTYVANVLGLFPPGPPFSTGTVTFKDNGAVITSCVSVHVFFGLATCTVTYQATAGSPHAIVATYSGDAHHSPGTSNTVSETVYKAKATNKVTNSTPTTLGSTIKFSATVSGPGVTPTGTVTWNVSTPSGVTACASTATLSSGVATCSITATKAGSYSVSDSYGGDANYTSAGSNTDMVSVAKATPTNVVTNSAPPALGGNITFSATVSGVSGITPTGSVTWHVSGSAGATSCGSTTALSGGVATCVITATKGGTYVVSDTYGGDSNYTSAPSNTDTVSIGKITPTNKVTNSSPTKVGSTITFTAAVSELGVTPTGTVTWNVSKPSGVTSCASTATLSGGVATCTITASKAGTYSVSDTYNGDANYTSAPSNTDTVTVTVTVSGKTDHLSVIGGSQS